MMPSEQSDNDRDEREDQAFRQLMSPSYSPSRKELELLRVLADYSEPQPAAVLARIIRYRDGASAPVVYDRLGALRRKGLVDIVGGDWYITIAGRSEVRINVAFRDK